MILRPISISAVDAISAIALAALLAITISLVLLQRLKPTYWSDVGASETVDFTLPKPMTRDITICGHTFSAGSETPRVVRCATSTTNSYYSPDPIHQHSGDQHPLGFLEPPKPSRPVD